MLTKLETRRTRFNIEGEKGTVAPVGRRNTVKGKGTEAGSLPQYRPFGNETEKKKGREEKISLLAVGEVLPPPSEKGRKKGGRKSSPLL